MGWLRALLVMKGAAKEGPGCAAERRPTSHQSPSSAYSKSTHPVPEKYGCLLFCSPVYCLGQSKRLLRRRPPT